MSLNPSFIGNNPSQPMASAESYIPDQLIAGNLKLVSDNGIVTGAAVLPRGSVMGLTKFGSVSGTPGKAFASGTILIAVLPAAGDTVTIGGTAITFAAAVPDVAPPPGTVYIGATTALTAQALLAYLEGSIDANLVKFTYSLNASTITATAAVPGTGGNALTLATSDAGAITLSGATLAGGTANTGNATVSAMSAGPKVQPGNYVATCTDATHAQVVDPNGEEVGIATFGAAFVDTQINFTITAGVTPCAAGDTFVFAAAPAAAGIYKLCTAGAVDGSEVPAAILVDFTDPTAGNVSAGVYLMGEFNANAIVFDPSLSIAGIKAAFMGKGIFIKNSVAADDPS
jgi:hypothetical protein